MDAEVFYPGDEVEESAYDEARAICEACPVRATCQSEAMANREEYGMWGGLTPLERRRIRRKQRPSSQIDYNKRKRESA